MQLETIYTYEVEYNSEGKFLDEYLLDYNLEGEE